MGDLWWFHVFLKDFYVHDEEESPLPARLNVMVILYTTVGLVWKPLKPLTPVIVRGGAPSC